MPRDTAFATHRARVLRQAVVALTGVLAVAVPLMTAAPGPASAAGLGQWHVVSSPNLATNSTLTAVTAITPSDVWAVGSGYNDPLRQQALIAHFDGTAWSLVPAPVLDPTTTAADRLLAVSGVSANDVWAVGMYGVYTGPTQPLIEHWNGAGWAVVPGPLVGLPQPGGGGGIIPAGGALGAELSGVAAISSKDVWAVGHYRDPASLQIQPLIERWNGHKWSIVDSPAPAGSDLAGVAAYHENDVWAVGNDGMGPLILHWDGKAWAVSYSQVVVQAGGGGGGGGSGPGTLTAVTALAASDVWAVGQAQSLTTGLMETLTMHWDGTSWTSVSSASLPLEHNFLLSVSAASSDDVWAVGYSYSLTTPRGEAEDTLTLHWDGASWSVVRSRSPGVFSQLWGVAALGKEGAWAVGFDEASGPQSAVTLIEQYR